MNLNFLRSPYGKKSECLIYSLYIPCHSRKVDRIKVVSSTERRLTEISVFRYLNIK